MVGPETRPPTESRAESTHPLRSGVELEQGEGEGEGGDGSGVESNSRPGYGSPSPGKMALAEMAAGSALVWHWCDARNVNRRVPGGGEQWKWNCAAEHTHIGVTLMHGQTPEWAVSCACARVHVHADVQSVVECACNTQRRA